MVFYFSISRKLVDIYCYALALKWPPTFCGLGSLPVHARVHHRTSWGSNIRPYASMEPKVLHSLKCRNTLQVYLRRSTGPRVVPWRIERNQVLVNLIGLHIVDAD